MTLYNADISYNANIPYNGQEDAAGGSGGATRGSKKVSRVQAVLPAVQKPPERKSLVIQNIFVVAPPTEPEIEIEGFAEEDDVALVLALLELSEDF